MFAKLSEPGARVYTTTCPICVDLREGGKPEYPEKNPGGAKEKSTARNLNSCK